MSMAGVTPICCAHNSIFIKYWVLLHIYVVGILVVSVIFNKAGVTMP